MSPDDTDVEQKKRWSDKMLAHAKMKNVPIIIIPDTYPLKYNPITKRLGKQHQELADAGYELVLIHKRVQSTDLDEILRRGRERSKCNGR